LGEPYLQFGELLRLVMQQNLQETRPALVP
jgi:hypothetical protein